MLETDKNGIALKELCKTISEMLTHRQINDYLNRLRIEIKSAKQSGYLYETNKSDKIYNSIVSRINVSKSDRCLYDFIEAVFDISQFTDKENNFELWRERINRILMTLGFEVNLQGKISTVRKASTILEIDERISNLKKEIETRKLHKEVIRFCSKEYLAKDYFHASFEACKGIYDRLRKMVGLNYDGQNLVEKIFNKTQPMIWITEFKPSDQNDLNEFFGLKDLIISIHKMVRNPTGHKPRIYASNDFDECIEVLTIISRIRRYLDKCQVLRYGV
jgi:uncharacterized protein (TIGR02391 family)